MPHPGSSAVVDGFLGAPALDSKGYHQWPVGQCGFIPLKEGWWLQGDSR